MEINLTGHCKQRMKERGITKAQIEKIIENPEHIKQSFEGKILARRKIASECIEIVYFVEKNKDIVVVTCYRC